MSIINVVIKFLGVSDIVIDNQDILLICGGNREYLLGIEDTWG